MRTLIAVLVPVVMIALLWVLVIIPQQRRIRDHEAFVKGLSVGDEVITTAGVYGTITDLADDRARLRIAPDVEITVARLAIGQNQAGAAPEPAEPAIDQDDPSDTDGPTGTDRSTTL